jgi:hypothetical protein
MFSATQGIYTPADPASLIGGSILFAVVAALACAVPVRRAIRVEPVVALRYEQRERSRSIIPVGVASRIVRRDGQISPSA